MMDAHEAFAAEREAYYAGLELAEARREGAREALEALSVEASSISDDKAERLQPENSIAWMCFSAWLEEKAAEYVEPKEPA